MSSTFLFTNIPKLKKEIVFKKFDFFKDYGKITFTEQSSPPLTINSESLPKDAETQLTTEVCCLYFLRRFPVSVSQLATVLSADEEKNRLEVWIFKIRKKRFEKNT